jgi:hypothetical protein
MNDREQSQEAELKRLFQILNSPLNDRDFVRDVMRRANQHARIRRLTLAAAGTIGIAISVGPFIQLVNGLVERLALAEMHWAESMRLIEVPVLAAVILSSVALPSVLRWMSR